MTDDRRKLAAILPVDWRDQLIRAMANLDDPRGSAIELIESWRPMPEPTELTSPNDARRLRKPRSSQLWTSDDVTPAEHREVLMWEIHTRTCGCKPVNHSLKAYYQLADAELAAQPAGQPEASTIVDRVTGDRTEYPQANRCNCPGSGTHAHVTSCRLHPEAQR